MSVRPAKTQVSLGIRPVWSESSLSAWRKLGSLATHWAHSEDSDQTGGMPRLIWVFAGRVLILLVFSCHGSFLILSRLLLLACDSLLYNLSSIMTKPTKWLCAQRRLRSAWHPPSLIRVLVCTYCVAKDSSFLHADSKDSDQTRRMPRLIWVFAGRNAILLVLSWSGSLSFWSRSQIAVSLFFLYAFQKTVSTKQPTYWHTATEGWQTTTVSRGANCSTEIISPRAGYLESHTWR